MGIPTRRRGRFARLIVGGLLVVAPAGAASSSSIAATSPALVSGWGAPLLAAGVAPAGVTSGSVTAMVTPDIQTVGASASPVAVGAAPIDGSGNFALYANPGTGPMASIVANAIQNNNGWVNFDLQEIGADGTMTLQSVSRQFASSLNQPVSEAGIQSDGGVAANIGSWQGDGAISDSSPITNGSSTVDSSSYAVLRQPSAAAASAAATENADALATAQQLDSVSPEGGVGGGNCLGNTTLQNETNSDVVVGELHTANDTTASFTYGQTADTAADVGIELAGTGQYNVSGSVHIGNAHGSTAGTGWNEGSQFGYKLKTGFLHKHYYTVEPQGCGSNYYSVKTSEWTATPDGKALGDYIHNLDNNCKNSSFSANFQGAGPFDRSSHAFTHFGGAFNVFGFNGGARSGASQYARAHWQFGTQQNHYLCGSDNYVTQFPHRIFAGFG